MIGLAGQSAAVDPNLTGRENLKLIGTLAQLSRSAIGPRADELLERFQLVDAANRPIRTYSGGMRRRLDVAAALVGKPPVIFLDEPTTGLDIQSRTELWHVIEELVAEGSTVLLTTQYLEEADQLADRIAVVNNGLVVANDTAASLKARLGSTVIELTLKNDIEAKKAQNLLSRLVSDHPEQEGDKVRLSTTEAPKVLTQVLRSMDANHMAALGITVRDPSLDDVFLSLTGKHAVATDAAGPTGKPADEEPASGRRLSRRLPRQSTSGSAASSRARSRRFPRWRRSTSAGTRQMRDEGSWEPYVDEFGQDPAARLQNMLDPAALQGGGRAMSS